MYNERWKEKSQPYLFPPTNEERFAQDRRDERDERRRRYFALKSKKEVNNYVKTIQNV